MKRKIIMRSLTGAPVGLTICTAVTIIFSMIYGKGEYYAAPHELIAACGGELRAVMLQTVFGMLYGAVWGGASVIWEIESWSLLRMTWIHLLLCSVSSFPIAYCLQWMPHSIQGACGFFGIFFAVYAGIWFFKYNAMKKQVEQINSGLQEKNH